MNSASGHRNTRRGDSEISWQPSPDERHNERRPDNAHGDPSRNLPRSSSPRSRANMQARGASIKRLGLRRAARAGHQVSIS
jgi:hypothetical protein